MKKLISLLMAATFLVCALTSCGDTTTPTDDTTVTTSATTDTNGSTGDNTSTDPVVKPTDDSLTPGSIDFDPVTSASGNMIAIKYYKENVKNLIIGDTYTDEDGTVYTVYSVGIGPGYKVCDDYSYSLESLVIKGGNTKKVEGYSFQNAPSLVAVSIGEGVETIGDLAFFRCTALETLVLPSTLTSIGGSSFQGCTSLTELVIPSSVTSIGNSAFGSCTSLTKVTLPSRFNDPTMLKDIFLSQSQVIEFTFVD